MADNALPAFFAGYRDPLGPDQRPFDMLAALHRWRGLLPTSQYRFPWSEFIGEGWVFHMNGSYREAQLCKQDGGGAAVCLPRHLLVFRHGEPVLLIDPSGGWGSEADRAAFTARLAIFLETLKGEAA